METNNLETKCNYKLLFLVGILNYPSMDEYIKYLNNLFVDELSI